MNVTISYLFCLKGTVSESSIEPPCNDRFTTVPFKPLTVHRDSSRVSVERALCVKIDYIAKYFLDKVIPRKLIQD